MINKRLKRSINKIKKSHRNIRLSPGIIAVIAGCLLLLVITTFTQIKYTYYFPTSSIISTFHFEYIPQIPVVIFIAALLEQKWGVITVLLYIVLGLTPNYPIFALGGGVSYIFKYSFGFIAAYLPAAYYTAKELKRGHSVLSVILALFYGVFIIHIIGIAYMTVIALMQGDNWSFIYDLIYYQSLTKIVYDLVFSLAAIILAKIFRKMLWIIA